MMQDNEPGEIPAKKGLAESLKEWKIPLTALIIFVVPIAAIIVYSKVSQSGRDEQKSIDACIAGVKIELLSPSSAAFSDITTTQADGGTWNVRGNVDAANPYGAKLRTDFTCTAVHPASGIAKDVSVSSR